jgi:hypothetical protein
MPYRVNTERYGIPAVPYPPDRVTFSHHLLVMAYALGDVNHGRGFMTFA